MGFKRKKIGAVKIANEFMVSIYAMFPIPKQVQTGLRKLIINTPMGVHMVKYDDVIYFY